MWLGPRAAGSYLWWISLECARAQIVWWPCSLLIADLLCIGESRSPAIESTSPIDPWSPPWLESMFKGRYNCGLGTLFFNLEEFTENSTTFKHSLTQLRMLFLATFFQQGLWLGASISHGPPLLLNHEAVPIVHGWKLVASSEARLSFHAMP
jgi:hypothetical protein